MPSTPIVALGMCTTGILRGVGDARRAMYVTLGGGIAAAILDPIFIFGLDLGLDGAAISTVLSRFVMLGVGIYGAHYRPPSDRAFPTAQRLLAAARPFFAIGVPAVLTQIATPVGNAYRHRRDRRVSATRRSPAGRSSAASCRSPSASSSRCRARSGRSSARISARGNTTACASTMRDSLTVTIVYVLVVWALLALFAGPIADAVRRDGHGARADRLLLPCSSPAASCSTARSSSPAPPSTISAIPTYSTVFNWGRSTLGVIPFVWVGAH